MLRSLFTGVSGLSAHKQMLDVTANNIANVNTTGFKSSTTVFEDTLSQTLTGGGAATATAGGTNATQIGLGVKLAATSLNFTQGAYQATGVASNMIINGDGFFVVSNNGQEEYTRAGSFSLDDQGQLVSPDGSIAMGYGTTTDPVTGATSIDTTQLVPLKFPGLTNGTYASYSIDSNGVISAVNGSTGAIDKLGQVGMATFANPNGLVKSGDTEFIASGASGTPTYGTPSSGAMGSVTSGYIEMSNVNIAQEMTNLIIAQRGFQANSKVISTSDEVLQTLVNLKN